MDFNSDDDLSFGNVLQLLDLLSIMVTNNTTSFQVNSFTYQQDRYKYWSMIELIAPKALMTHVTAFFINIIVLLTKISNINQVYPMVVMIIYKQ